MDGQGKMRAVAATGMVLGLACAGALLSGGHQVNACGPYFPNRLLVQGDQAVLEAPVGDFWSEIKRIPKPNDVWERNPKLGEEETLEAQSVRLDVEDVREALRGRPANEVNQIVECYTVAAKTAREKTSTSNSAPKAPAPQLDIPAAVPAVFRHYLQALAYFNHDQFQEAFGELQKVLALPERQRRPREVWAHYLLGRVHMHWGPREPDTKAARRAFEHVRALAKAGTPDPLCLASASLGRLGKLALDEQDFVSAFHLYFQEYHAGGTNASTSLLWTAHDVLDLWVKSPPEKLPEPVKAVVRDRLSVWVVAAYLVSAGGGPTALDFPKSDKPDRLQRFVRAIHEQGEEKVNVPLADRLGWAAYQEGDWKTAGELIAVAEKGSAITHWVQAKLLLRSGKRDAGIAELQQAIQSLEAKDELRMTEEAGEYPDAYRMFKTNSAQVRTRGELGLLRLSQGQYFAALELMLQGNYLMDAAYVAERVLTADEVLKYLASHPKDPFLVELIGARLVREKRYEDAKPYFTGDAAKRLETYAKSLKNGRDDKLTKRERALAWMEAARIARWWGDQLMATQIAPDWRTMDLQYEPYEDKNEPEPRTSITKATKDELTRAKQTPIPTRRWHYRYIALDHAWQASQLLPDNDLQLAQWLVEAGQWVAAKDPKAADKFYRALALRCPQTPLGQEAAKVRWFPATQPIR